jgi:hypothetical protein
VNLRHFAHRLHPALVVLVIQGLLLAWALHVEGGDPLALAQLGTRFSQGDPQGTEGYDGQFNIYIGRDPRPGVVAPYLDVPAYRYQRILLPLLGYLLSGGDQAHLAWTLPILLLLAHGLGTWAVAELLAGYGVSRWYALVYGLFAGFSLSLRLDLAEPLAFALVALALLANARRQPALSWITYALALFARELTVIFAIAQLLAELFQHRWRHAIGLALTALLPFGLFQLWLWQVFGQPGIGSGGAMATGFEWIPYMGLWRIGAYSGKYLLAMLVVFGPTVLLPSAWGFWQGLVNWIKRDRNVLVLGLFLNAISVMVMPFSTFRETGGVIRYICGLALSVLLYAASRRNMRVLNYSFLWLVLNTFLFLR